MRKCNLKGMLPIFLVVLIIWGHSMMPHDASFWESGFIVRFLASLFGRGVFLEYIIRRLAHVIEYTILGMALSAFCFRARTFKAFLQTLNFCLLVAFMDETIQIFSGGRAAEIADVWLDMSGALAGALIMTAIRWMKRKRE